jgi:3-deoxy-D-manno-oct-2-ulosonic acid (Kdo) hydroxylase
MHRCHNAMKEDSNFQETTPRHRWEFPPNSSWMVCTDCVSHAVLTGQYALEQTVLIPQSALIDPQRSPLAILENLAGVSLTRS